jgi:hypothetical protein
MGTPVPARWRLHGRKGVPLLALVSDLSRASYFLARLTDTKVMPSYEVEASLTGT